MSSPEGKRPQTGANSTVNPQSRIGLLIGFNIQNAIAKKICMFLFNLFNLFILYTIYI